MTTKDEMTDMKQASGSKRYDMPASVTERSYPYGICLRLENEQLDKLGLDPLPKEDCALQIQITHMALANSPKKD